MNFGVGFGGGLCVLLMANYRKYWQRMLCILPLMISSEFLSPYTKAHNPDMDYMLPWMMGVFAGIALLVLARRKILPDEADPVAESANADANKSRPETR